jgi:hypothetical protein
MFTVNRLNHQPASCLKPFSIHGEFTIVSSSIYRYQLTLVKEFIELAIKVVKYGIAKNHVPCI